MTRARLSAWHTALSSALDIGVLANCGGTSQRSDGSSDSDAGSPSMPTTGGVGGTGGSGAGGTAGDGVGAVAGSAPGGAAGSAPGGIGGVPSCINPIARVSGFVVCDGGWVHREQRADCPSQLPRAEGVGVVESGCTSDADCTEHPEGWCYRADPNPSVCGAPSGRFVGRCDYGCVRDEDCAPGTICLCGASTGGCVPSDCITDADCSGLLCASSNSGFACQTASDECMVSSDCPAGYYCSGSRKCLVSPGAGGMGTGGTCGRPFLVAGEPRLAAVSGKVEGWSREAHPDVRRLTDAERARLSEHWTATARMEHASVAAFARFTLELVSLGAPAELVEGAQRAMGDEIEHARLCFGLAGAYGRAVGPGPLAVNGALDGRSFETIVETAILEACVGETLAAVEAEDAAERATDPRVRDVLARIARDEARHAELGFRFLAWALARAECRVRERIARAFAAAVAAELAACDTSLPADTRDLGQHGVPSPAERRAVRELALREILLPAVRSLVVSAADAPSGFELAVA